MKNYTILVVRGNNLLGAFTNKEAFERLWDNIPHKYEWDIVEHFVLIMVLYRKNLTR